MTGILDDELESGGAISEDAHRRIVNIVGVEGAQFVAGAFASCVQAAEASAPSE